MHPVAVGARDDVASSPFQHLDVAASDLSMGSDSLMDKLATTASSREDDDMKGSDSWRLQSDGSSISSRVTTPDPHSPPRSRPPLSSSTTDTQTTHGGRTPSIPIPIPIPGAVPPPPPPSRLLRRINRPRRILELAHDALPRESYTDDVPGLSRTFSSENRMRRQNNLVIHPSKSTPEVSPTAQEEPPVNYLTKPLSVLYGLPNYRYQIGERIQNPTFPHELFPQEGMEDHANLDIIMQTHHEGHSRSNNGNQLESLNSSWMGQNIASSISTDAESGEDLVAYRNARQFPPQLPAHLGSHMSNPRSRSSATNRITNWVTRYEKSHHPGRTRRRETARNASSDGPENETAESHVVSDSSHAEVEQLWQQLKEKRAKLRDTRDKMATIRKELRKLRWHKEEADNAFMTVVRPLLVGQRSDAFLSSLKLLDSRMIDMLKLREDHHFREASYERLEIELDEEEEELSALETKFFSLLAAGQDRQDGAAPVTARTSTAIAAPILSVDMPYELIGIQAERTLEDVHPLYVELSDAVGDLENMKDDYGDLQFAYLQYEDERNLRESTGQDQSAEAEAFFAEFSADEATMKTSMAKLEDKVQRLKRLCQEKRVMKKHLSVQMAYILEPDMTYEDLDLDSTADILRCYGNKAHSRYAELLSQPNHLLENSWPMTAEQALRAATRLPSDDPWKSEKQRLAAKEYSIETLLQGHAGDTKADMVNKWLLHQLRTSPINVLFLQSIFGSNRLKIRDHWRWQCDVMFYWWRDSTRVPHDDENAISSTGMSELSGYRSTSRPSRAISEVNFRLKRRSIRRLKSSEMLRL